MSLCDWARENNKNKFSWFYFPHTAQQCSRPIRSLIHVSAPTQQLLRSQLWPASTRLDLHWLSLTWAFLGLFNASLYHGLAVARLTVLDSQEFLACSVLVHFLLIMLGLPQDFLADYCRVVTRHINLHYGIFWAFIHHPSPPLLWKFQLGLWIV